MSAVLGSKGGYAKRATGRQAPLGITTASGGHQALPVAALYARYSPPFLPFGQR